MPNSDRERMSAAALRLSKCQTGNNDALKLPSIRRAAIGGHHDSPRNCARAFPQSQPQAGGHAGTRCQVLWNALFNKPRSTVPRQPLPVLSPSRAELDATVDGSLFRLGHSTLLLKLAGSWWLTDPVFSERASPLPFAGPKRFHAPPVALADLPPIRGVILSHDHYDHLDRAAIKALVPLVELFLAPLGVGDRLLAWGVPPGKVRQLDWWQGIEAGGLRLTATPAQHFSGSCRDKGKIRTYALQLIVFKYLSSVAKLLRMGFIGFYSQL